MLQRHWKVIGVLLSIFVIWKVFLASPRIKTKLPYQLIYKETIYGGKAYGPIPMLIMLHGSGGDETNWIKYFSIARSPIRVISFRGPISSGLRGYDWSGPTRGDTQEKANQLFYSMLKDSAKSVAMAIPELARKYPTKGKPFLTGFSAGGEIAYTIAANYPDVFDTIFPLSGRLNAAVIPLEKIAGEPMTTVIAYHAPNDEVISFGTGVAAVKALSDLGIKATLVEHNAGHMIPANVFSEIAAKILE